jgi:hypothetical protein
MGIGGRIPPLLEDFVVLSIALFALGATPQKNRAE